MIIDADAHFTPRLIPNTGNQQANHWIEKYLQRKNGQFSQVDQRRQELQMLGVDRQLLNPMGKSLELFYNIDLDLAPHIMRCWNNALFEITATNQCFDMNIWLALQDIDASLEEIDRALDQQFFGIHVSEGPRWGFIKELDPIFAKIAQHKIPWYQHLTVKNDDLCYEQTVPERFRALEHEWQNKPWLFSLASLILGGVLEKHPNLRIVVAERDFDWIDQFRTAFQQHDLDDPMPYLQKNFWFTIEPERENFADTAQHIGFDRLLFATDWPHDHDVGGANSRNDVAIINQLDLNPDCLRQICCDNYLALCR